MSNLGFRIFTSIERPDKELVKQFASLPVANIADNMGRIACIDTAIKPFNEAKLLGCAVTVKAPQGDNLMFLKALDIAQEGDIIVVDGGGYMGRALCGEIMMRYAKHRKLGGFLVDGVIRDKDATSKSDFPVYARGTNPNGPYKNGPGEINVPITIGGQVVFPGDIIVGDDDGVVIIRPNDALELLEKVIRFNKNEEVIIKGLENGLGMDREWIDKTLIEKNCEIL
ncbi:MAG: RraA family protein [Tissierellaceae bacterium]|nr:RraA family protein [Tissierellaceae bacterium]